MLVCWLCAEIDLRCRQAIVIEPKSSQLRGPHALKKAYPYHPRGSNYSFKICYACIGLIEISGTSYMYMFPRLQG